jgi:hypothetical protein
MTMKHWEAGAADMILTNERVCLGIDVPELALSRGDVGVVRSAWLFPQRAYEVEFPRRLGTVTPRVLLLHEKVVRGAEMHARRV